MANDNPASQAFSELIGLLQSAERDFLTARNQTEPVDIAGCYNNVLNLAGIAIDCYLNNDPARPHFAAITSPWRKMGGDNSHAIIEFAPLQAGKSYRITGNRGGTIYLGFTLYGGEAEDDVDVDANLNSSQLNFDDNGNFELVITPAAQPMSVEGNNIPQLESLEKTHSLLVRQYFSDSNTSNKPSLHIEVLDGNDTSDTDTDRDHSTADKLMAARIQSMTRFIKGWIGMTPIAWPDDAAAYNQACPPFRAAESTGHWSTPDTIHSFGFYQLKDNEALLVKGTSVDCLYWSCHLWSSCMHTFDYTRYDCAIAKEQVVYNDDGSWELVIAHKDPARPNWIDTTGLGRGFIYFRWLEASEVPPAMSCEVIQL